MSIVNAVSFCERMSTDPGLERRAAEALADAAGPAAIEALVALGATVGLEFSAEELAAVGRHLASGSELSDAQLASVAGGNTVGDSEQLANVDLQNTMQKEQQLLQMLSNVVKSISGDSSTIVRNIS